MLLFAAALLTASMHSQGVVEAPAVRAVAVVQATSSAPMRHAPPEQGRDGAVDALADATGQRWLEALAAAPPTVLRAADADGRVLTTAMDDPPTSSTVTAWWSALSPATRTVLTDDAPAVVGNLDGVPFDVRDAANRAVLTSELADSQAPTALAAMLGQVQESLEQEPGDPRKYLVTLDTRGEWSVRDLGR
ncbi:hypothetical protein [Curtobacterium sp. MCJR17_043]|uniref:hypothetical protein n=1 Tax=Curtobacterium sp. MCJR17_043 TaxID=2175660 RepID=UPI0024DFD245|nr:hypothetical protein [Curtobacterium sp. MCJR17_043]WIB36751.1 hypothetical protein DEJ15_06885 [Curtobacterium sp. MCJR17_043]